MKQNTIFLDIDGVLNSDNFFHENKGINNAINKLENKEETFYLRQINDLNYNSILLLKELANETNSDIVITSAWKNIRIWPLIEEYLVNKGLPIVDTTTYIKGNRCEEIAAYLKSHPDIKRYIIIDDELFKGYENYFDSFIHTNFHNEGLTEEIVSLAKTKLKNN